MPKKRPRVSAKKPDALQKYRDLLAIDKYQLDEELIRQPQYFTDVADELARALQRRDMASETSKATFAEVLDQYCRTTNPDTNKLYTKTLAEKLVETDTRYQKARTDYKDKSMTAARWEGLREAWRQRGSMLRDLVQLHVSSHYQDTGYDATRAAMSEKRKAR